MIRLLNIVFVLALLISSVFTSELTAQAYDFRSYSVSDGLPHGQITDILQTSDGYIWIGIAASGLVRFDGSNFETFGITHGLKDDMILRLFEDAEQQLWVATYSGGMAVMLGDTLVYPFRDHEVDQYYITNAFQDLQGRMWLSTFGQGIFIYDGHIESEGSYFTHDHALRQPIEHRFERLSADDGLAGSTVWNVKYMPDGTIWFATHTGLSIFDGEQYHNYTTENGLSGDKVFNIIPMADGSVWLSTSRGITIYRDGEFEHITSIADRQINYIFDILLDSQGTLWIGTENDGIYMYQEGEFTHITRLDGLVSNFIHRLYEDENGNIWVGTDENGISIFRGETFRFLTTTHGLKSREVLALLKHSNGTVWIGTNDGFQSYDGRNFRNFDIPDSYGSLNEVWGIIELENGNILILSDTSELLEFNGSTFTSWTRRYDLQDWYIYDVIRDSSGNLWIGADEGLLRLRNGSIDIYKSAEGLPGTVIYNIFEDTDGKIWVATNLGAAWFDNERFHAITYRDGLGHYNVNVITQDKYGDIWFGTSAGVTHLSYTDDGTKVFKSFGRAEGMRLVETQFLWFDDNDQLWQGTNGGIHRLDVAGYRQTGQMEIEHYKLSRHGIGVETLHKSVVYMGGDIVWFGTMEGIVIANVKKALESTSFPPRVYLTGGFYNGQPFRLNGSRGDRSRKFPAGNNSFSFEFSALEFVNPENIHYRYRLTGFDNDWRSTPSGASAIYSNLAPGNYTFEVEAKVGTGTWNAAASPFHFTINRPFWQTSWFWMIVLVGFLITTYVLIRARLNRLERDKLNRLVDEQTRHLKKALEEKEVLFREVHHRVKNNLAMVYGLMELQASGIKDKNAKTLIQDSQMRIYSMSLIHERLYQNGDLSKIDARTYIGELLGEIEKTAATDHRSIHQKIDIDDIRMSIDQGIPCGLILNELVNNAYKHAFNGREQGQLEVSFKKINGKVLLKVTDDGIGLPEGFKIGNLGEGNSLGVVLVKELSEQLQGNLQYSSNGFGTKFELEFKVD